MAWNDCGQSHDMRTAGWQRYNGVQYVGSRISIDVSHLCIFVLIVKSHKKARVLICVVVSDMVNVTACFMLLSKSSKTIVINDSECTGQWQRVTNCNTVKRSTFCNNILNKEMHACKLTYLLNSFSCH